MIRRSLLLAATCLLAACAGGAGESGDPQVTIRIANAGSEPLQCRLIFGHWVERDLGLVESDAISVTVRQQPADGALYVMRPDGQRRMMVENIFCARPNDWQATVGQIDLAVVRTERPVSVSVGCALSGSGGRVHCGKPEFLVGGPSAIVE
jgi:hypothetical protein